MSLAEPDLLQARVEAYHWILSIIPHDPNHDCSKSVNAFQRRSGDAQVSVRETQAFIPRSYRGCSVLDTEFPYFMPLSILSHWTLPFSLSTLFMTVI